MQANPNPTPSAPTPSARRLRAHKGDDLGLRLFFHIVSREDAEHAVSDTQSVLYAYTNVAATLAASAEGTR